VRNPPKTARRGTPRPTAKGFFRQALSQRADSRAGFPSERAHFRCHESDVSKAKPGATCRCVIPEELDSNRLPLKAAKQPLEVSFHLPRQRVQRFLYQFTDELMDRSDVRGMIDRLAGDGISQRLPILHMSRSWRRSSIVIIPVTGWKSESFERNDEVQTPSTSCNGLMDCRSPCHGGCSTRWPASSSRRKPNRGLRSAPYCAWRSW